MVKYFENMKVSPTDRCTYRALELDNKLMVFLIHDPTTETAASALQVNVGSLRDPIEHQGLAHFLEHMLFVGSEKYPGVSDYSDFLSQNGGDFNAYTGRFATNYHFDIKEDRLPHALDMFAQFFICPLFSEELTFKEIKAVNSEAEMYYADDGWRCQRLDSVLCASDALLSKFDVGNLDTLGQMRGIVDVSDDDSDGDGSGDEGSGERGSGEEEEKREGSVEVEESKEEEKGGKGVKMEISAEEVEKRKKGLIQALKDFHKKYYSANQMVLCVYAKSGLDETEELVKKIFSSVENKNLPYESFKNEIFPFPKDHLKKQVKVVTLNKGTTLKFAFKLEQTLDDVHFKSAEYLSHLLGHETEGSILFLLQEEELAVSLEADLEREEEYYTGLTVSINLTEKGAKPENLNKVISVVGAYINMLKSVSPQKWMYDEISHEEELGFKYHEADIPLETCTRIVESYQEYREPANVLYSPFEYREYKPDKISRLIDMLTPDNIILMYMSDELANADDITSYTTDDIYKTRYLVEDLQDNFHDSFTKGDISWSTVSCGISMPAPNPFFPKNFEVNIPANVETIPSKALDSDRSQIWHLQDGNFLQPKSHLYGIIYLDRRKMFGSCDQNILLNIWVRLLQNKINSMVYMAQLAQISFSIVQSRHGLSVELSCFSSSLPQFLEKLTELIDQFMSEGFTRDKFETVKHKLEVDLHENRNQCPADYLDLYLRSYITDTPVTLDKAMAAAAKITYQDAVEFGKTLFETMRFSWLAEGNLDKSEAVDLITGFEDKLFRIFKSQVLPSDLVNCRRAIKLEQGETVVLEEVSTQAESKNSCFMKLYQVSKEQYEDHRHLVYFLESYLMNPYFESLRTDQNLGYVVSVSTRTKSGIHHIACKVQSDVKNSHFCVDRSYLFMKERENLLEKLSNDEFNNIRQALVARLTQPHKSLAIQVGEHWREIKSHGYVFDRNAQLSKLLGNITKEDVLEFFRNVILVNPRIFEIHLYSQATKEESIAHRKERQEKQEGTKFRVAESIDDAKKSFQFYATDQK